jgi:hypothetical protein
MSTANTRPISVRNVTDRAAKLGLAIVTYHRPGARLPWIAEVVSADLAAGRFERITTYTPQGIVGKGSDPAEAIKALGVDF